MMDMRMADGSIEVRVYRPGAVVPFEVHGVDKLADRDRRAHELQKKYPSCRIDALHTQHYSKGFPKLRYRFEYNTVGTWRWVEASAPSEDARKAVAT